MWTPEYFTRYAELPIKVNGLTIPNDDGSFDVYINSFLSLEKRDLALRHELNHIMFNHFYSEQPVCELEKEADDDEKQSVTIPAQIEVKQIPLFDSPEDLALWLMSLNTKHSV